MISEQSTGFPDYNRVIGRDKATIGRILVDNGHAEPLHAVQQLREHPI